MNYIINIQNFDDPEVTQIVTRLWSAAVDLCQPFGDRSPREQVFLDCWSDLIKHPAGPGILLKEGEDVKVWQSMSVISKRLACNKVSNLDHTIANLTTRLQPYVRVQPDPVVYNEQQELRTSNVDDTRHILIGENKTYHEMVSWS